jgi:hypothetical protein
MAPMQTSIALPRTFGVRCVGRRRFRGRGPIDDGAFERTRATFIELEPAGE